MGWIWQYSHPQENTVRYLLFLSLPCFEFLVFHFEMVLFIVLSCFAFNVCMYLWLCDESCLRCSGLCIFGFHFFCMHFTVPHQLNKCHWGEFGPSSGIVDLLGNTSEGKYSKSNNRLCNFWAAAVWFAQMRCCICHSFESRC